MALATEEGQSRAPSRDVRAGSRRVVPGQNSFLHTGNTVKHKTQTKQERERERGRERGRREERRAERGREEKTDATTDTFLPSLLSTPASSHPLFPSCTVTVLRED